MRPSHPSNARHLASVNCSGFQNCPSRKRGASKPRPPTEPSPKGTTEQHSVRRSRTGSAVQVTASVVQEPKLRLAIFGEAIQDARASVQVVSFESFGRTFLVRFRRTVRQLVYLTRSRARVQSILISRPGVALSRSFSGAEQLSATRHVIRQCVPSGPPQDPLKSNSPDNFRR